MTTAMSTITTFSYENDNNMCLVRLLTRLPPTTTKRSASTMNGQRLLKALSVSSQKILSGDIKKMEKKTMTKNERHKKAMCTSECKQMQIVCTRKRRRIEIS